MNAKKRIDSSNGWATREQTTLLKACLGGGEEAKKAYADWRQRVDLRCLDEASYKLLPLLVSNPAFRDAQDPFFIRCRVIHRETWLSNWLHFRKALQQLNQLKMDRWIALKGLAMILGYYSDFGARVIGDLDLMVSRSEAPRIITALKEEGWAPHFRRLNPCYPGQLERWHAMNFLHPSGVNLDLHWGLCLESSPDVDEEVVVHARPVSEKFPGIYRPTSEALLFQICIHGIKHCAVPLIRWIADALLILNKDGPALDWDRLELMAKRSSLALSLHAALDYLQREFGAPIPPHLISRLAAVQIDPREQKEFDANARGHKKWAAWHRFCLRRKISSRAQTFQYALDYLQNSLLLSSRLQIPLFALQWGVTRLYRFLYKMAKKYVEVAVRKKTSALRDF
jgi:hypothetical protein